MNHRQPEQLNNAQFPAESEPEYTLEEIMAEFGAPQEPEPIPEPIPEPVPEPEPIPEPEPVQPEPQQTSPPEPQPERVHVFRPYRTGVRRGRSAALPRRSRRQKSGPCRSSSGRSRSRSRPRRSRPCSCAAPGSAGGAPA